MASSWSLTSSGPNGAARKSLRRWFDRLHVCPPLTTAASPPRGGLLAESSMTAPKTLVARLQRELPGGM